MYRGPLHFAAVCNRWRFVALWSSITFEGRTPSIKIINLWLIRSGHHPLTIHWINPFRTGNGAAFGALLPHRSRSIFIQLPINLLNWLMSVDLYRICEHHPLVHCAHLRMQRLHDVDIRQCITPGTCILSWSTIQSYKQTGQL